MQVHDFQAQESQVLSAAGPADLAAQVTPPSMEDTEAAADGSLAIQEADEDPEPSNPEDPVPQPEDPAADPVPQPEDPVPQPEDPVPQQEDPEPQPEDPAADPVAQPEEQHAWHCNRCGLGFSENAKRYRDHAEGGRRGVRQLVPLFRCGPCNSLRSSLTKEGHWDAVVALSKEKAREYFKEAKGLNPDQREDLLTRHKITNFDSKQSKKRKRSELQPLSVWEQRGYPVEKIKQNTPPEDIEEDDVLGTLYRVHLRVKDDIECNGWKAENQMLDPTESASADSRASTGSLIKSPEDRSNALVQQSKTAISICAHKLCKQMQTFI